MQCWSGKKCYTSGDSCRRKLQLSIIDRRPYKKGVDCSFVYMYILLSNSYNDTVVERHLLITGCEQSSEPCKYLDFILNIDFVIDIVIVMSQ